jgi:hypothetical protein
VSRFFRCGGLEIHRFNAWRALMLGDLQTRFSPTDQ